MTPSPAASRLIEWTFDPLEVKNAFFNIERLGTPSSAATIRKPIRTHGQPAARRSAPTDRCYAELVAGFATRQDHPLRRPHRLVARASHRVYPADIARIRAEDSPRARAIQQENAEKFQGAFAQGLAVTRFERSAAEGTYLLEPWK